MTRAAARPRKAEPARQALLILDLISRYEFDDWRAVLRAGLDIAPRIARLRERAHRADVPVIYVNDTEGRWEADQAAFVRRCAADDARGHEVVRRVAPAARDYFVFKPRHSGFYATPLIELLRRLGSEELILTGLTSHQCVLFTAMDAYVRDYSLVVPRDCIGAPRAACTAHALFVMREALRARTPAARALRFG